MANRIEKLAAHLAASPTSDATSSALQPLVNDRPGDQDATPVETSNFLTGIFTPVMDEICVDLSLSACCIDGTVPSGLRGTFLRIGPNPRFDFQKKPYHIFDGDGMIHKVCALIYIVV